MAKPKKPAGAKRGGASSKKPAGADKAPRAGKKKDGDTAPGMGHNQTAIKKQATAFADRYNKLLDDKESYSGEIMSSVKDLLEEAANAIGCKRAMLRIALKEQRAERKREAAEKEMEPGDLSQLDSLRDALGLFGDTPLGVAAQKAATLAPAGDKVEDLDFLEDPTADE